MLSIGLVATWVYHLADKSRYSKQRREIYIKDSMAVAQGVQDSLHKIYSFTIHELGVQLDSSKLTEGQLKNELSTKLAEIYRLRTEIATILKKTDVKKTDIDLARRKTIELQLLVNELQSRNSSIEEEKEQITAILDKVNVQVKSLESTNQQLDQQNKLLSEKMTLAAAFIATDVRLSPVMVRNEREQETSSASKTSKLIISFTVQNNIADYQNTDVFVVITQPDGSLLTNDVWESSSTIDTRNEGKKRYTRKIKFEYSKGEAKRLSFSINADEYQKGTYTLQLYHNGLMIGQALKSLS